MVITKSFRNLISVLVLTGIMIFSFYLTASAAFNTNVSAGNIVFDTNNTSGTGGGSVGAYRYGPSTIINSDNSIDMWLAAPGADGAWDYIRYRRSTDGGLTWTTEVNVLTPTAGGADAYSCCDPGVFKYGSYYYIGYTSTTSQLGSDHVFVARSTSPAGPFDKWNGSGWGGNPQPVITYTGPAEEFGAGEPSFVVKDGTLYIYYTWITRDANDNPVQQVRVNTASITNLNWPGSTSYRGVAFTRPPRPDLAMKQIGEDSSDVKYIDSLGKFYSFSMCERFSNDNYVKVRESSDGITFTPVGMIKTKDIKNVAHNMGVSGDALGHMDTAKNNFIAYAYGASGSGDPFTPGSGWGLWSLWMNPITISNNLLPVIPELYAVQANNGSATVYFETVPANSYRIKYGTNMGSFTTEVSNVTSSPYTVTGLTNGTQYSFCVEAINPNGSSGNSFMKLAKPLAYTVSPRTAASASSIFNSSWTAENVIDSSITTTWSSLNYSASATTQWIQVDTGANRNIKRVTLTPRQNTTHHYPVKFNIQVSTDGMNWTNADYTFNGACSGYVFNDVYTRQIYEFNSSINGRYVRIRSINLAADETYGVYFMQLGDIKIEEVSSSQTQQYFKIINKATGKVLHNTDEAYNGNAESVAQNVAAVPSWATDAQMWKLVDDGGGYYKIVNKYTGKCIHNTGETYNVNPTAQWAAAVQDTGVNEQRWQIVDCGDGYVNLVNKSTGKCLHNTAEVYNGNPLYNNIAAVQDTGANEQKWQLVQQ